MQTTVFQPTAERNKSSKKKGDKQNKHAHTYKWGK